MVRLKPGDRVDCKIYANEIVGPYKYYDDIRTFEIIAVDLSGCYLFIPNYILLKNSKKIDTFELKSLNINSKFLGEQFAYISFSFILNIKSFLDGLHCKKCKEFIDMAEPNQPDGTIICWSCKNNPYR